MRPGQRTITVLMLVVCAAVGVAIAGFPHRSSEPAIRLTDSAGASGTDPSTTALDATTTSSDPTTTTSTSTSTTRPPETPTTKPHKATAATAKPAAATAATSTTKAPANTIPRYPATTTVRPSGLNPDGR